MRSLLLSAGATLVAADAHGTTLTITTGTQQGFFKTGDDVGEPARRMAGMRREEAAELVATLARLTERINDVIEEVRCEYAELEDNGGPDE